MDRHVIVGVLGLHFAYMPVHDAPLNEKLTTLNIEITPLQPRDFADAKSKHCATTTIVRYGSGKLARTAWNVSLVRIMGRLRRFVESLTRTIPTGLRRSLKSSQRAAHSKMSA